MSIKSEKAKNAIKGVIPMYVAERAVELAESDAEQRCRERAVRAFQQCCGQYHPEDGCHRGLAVFTICKPEECRQVQQFLKYYDNE